MHINFPLVLAIGFASSSFMVDCCGRFIGRFLLPCLTDLILEDSKQSFAFGDFIFRVENMPFISSASMCGTWQTVFSQPEVGIAVRHSYRNSSPAPHPLCKLLQLLSIPPSTSCADVHSLDAPPQAASTCSLRPSRHQCLRCGCSVRLLGMW